MEKAVRVSQHCLDAIPAEKFLQGLTKDIQMYRLQFRGTYRSPQKRLLIAEYLKKKGVTRARSISEHIDVSGTIKKGISRQTMVQDLRRIAKTYGVPINKFNVEKVTLMDKKETCSITFKRMYKQIKLPDDKRRKKMVIGLVASNGDKSAQNRLLARLSAKKITCTLAKTEKTIVMCSEEIVQK